MNHQPLVSVLMPVYNGARYLRESIESVLRQTYSNFDFFIINDGSTDNSEEIVHSFKDKRICYSKNVNNLGLIPTLNKGLSLATGKYVFRMDADDICLPERFRKQILFMESNPEVGVCGCCADVIDKKDVKMKYDAADTSIRVKMLYQCHLLHPSVIIRRELMDKYGLRYNSEFIHAEDYDLFYRIGKFAKLANLTEVLILYREHRESVSRIYEEVQNANSLKVIKQQFHDIGMEISELEIDLFKEVMNATFDFTQKELQDIERLLLKIIQTNHYSKKLDEGTLNDILFQKWKAILMNDTKLGLKNYLIGMNSSLLKYGSFTAAERITLLVKSILKY